MPPWWFAWPPRPVNLYRVTQGLHVVTGLALIQAALFLSAAIVVLALPGLWAMAAPTLNAVHRAFRTRLSPPPRPREPNT